MHPSMDKFKQTKSSMSITAIWDKKEEISLGSTRAVAAVRTLIRTGGRDSSILDTAEAEIDTG